MIEVPVPHAWNTGFAWATRSGSPTTLTSTQVGQYDEHGYTVVPDLLDPDTVRDALAEIDPREAEGDALLAQVEDERIAIAERGAITFSVHLVRGSERLRSLAKHPTILGICADLIGPDVNLYWDQAVYKKPEKPRRFPWHQDNGYAFVEPQQYLTVWIALTDATVHNGCPWVAPGLHRHGTLRHTYLDPLGFECFNEVSVAKPAPVPAGGAVVFSSLTPHLTGPNRTDAVRKAYILQYAPVGATVLRGDPDAGPPTSRELADDPQRQFAVLRNGVPS